MTDDLISRKAALDAAADYTPEKHSGMTLQAHVTGKSIQDALRALPPVPTSAAPDTGDNLREAARVLLDNMPGEHQCWADLQDAVDEGRDEDDCVRAWLRAIAGGDA